MTAQAAVPEGETVKVIEDKWIDAKNATGPRTLFGLAATTRDDGNGGTEIARVLPFIALRAGGRAELAYADVAREHAGLVGETGENHQPEAVEALAALVDSATFVGLGAEPLEPPPVPGDLDGVYRGTSIFWTVGMNAQMVADVTHPTITFFADGTFADGLPPGGLNGFDYADAAMSHTDEVGTYRRSTNANGGPTVELHFASGEVEEYAGSDGSLPGAVTRPDGTILVPVGVAPDGWTFDGERSTSFVQTTGFAGSGTFSAVSGGSSIRFRKDGTAESDRWSAFSSNTETGDARTGAAGANESPVAPARYAIDGGILTLTAPDGSATTYAALNHRRAEHGRRGHDHDPRARRKAGVRRRPPARAGHAHAEVRRQGRREPPRRRGVEPAVRLTVRPELPAPVPTAYLPDTPEPEPPPCDCPARPPSPSSSPPAPPPSRRCRTPAPRRS